MTIFVEKIFLGISGGAMLAPYVNVQVAVKVAMAGMPMVIKTTAEVAGGTADDAREQFYDDIFESSYGEQFNPVREQAIAGTEEIEGGSVLNTLTNAQKSRLKALDNTIEHNLKDTDFSGTLRDLQGNPIPNPQGGFYDYLTEMRQSYSSLTKIRRGLEGSLSNPNLYGTDRVILQEGLDKTNVYIEKIEQLFEPFGGIN